MRVVGPGGVLLAELVETSRAVAATPRRLEKIALLADLLRRLAPPEVAVAVSYLVGDLPQGRIGLGFATLAEAASAAAPAERPSLTLADVDAAFARVAAVSGPGSAAERRRLLAGLLGRATRSEQEFLLRMAAGELRQGALEGVMVEAVARAAGAPASELRRALMAAGDLAGVASATLAEGPGALGRFRLRLMTPVLPMLAETAGGVEDALSSLGEAAFEYKLDGARVQVHRDGEEVRVFSRALNEVTPAVPEIVAAVRALPSRRLILDGEAVAFGPGGMPQPFQVSMRRFGRKLEVERVRRELPLAALFFDVLHLEGEDLVARSTRERGEAMAGALPPSLVVPRLSTADPGRAAAFLQEALKRGHEGVMAKSLAAPYQAGRRGGAWLKVKPAHTLDLVVLAAEWGHGRRRGWLSNLHLGARDPAAGGFAMLGKTFKGMTDEMLAWQTERLLSLQLATDGHVVHVRPELVVEVAFDGLQASPRYPAGLALRFARVKRYRADKRPEEADTIEAVRALHRRRLPPDA